MKEIVNLSRRHFVQSSMLAGGGLVLGFYLPNPQAEAQQPAAGAGPQQARFAPNAFVRIGADESVLVIVNHAEMGQGCMTSLADVMPAEGDA